MTAIEGAAAAITGAAGGLGRAARRWRWCRAALGASRSADRDAHAIASAHE